MKKATFAFCASGLMAAACAAPPQGAPTQAAPAPGSIRPSRDGDIAIRQEYDRAVETGTAAALRLFIARHPGHPLAAEAAAHLEQMDKI